MGKRKYTPAETAERIGYRVMTPDTYRAIRNAARIVSAGYAGIDRAEVESRTLAAMARRIGKRVDRNGVPYATSGLLIGRTPALAYKYAESRARRISSKLATGRGSMPAVDNAEREERSPNYSPWYAGVWVEMTLAGAGIGTDTRPWWVELPAAATGGMTRERPVATDTRNVPGRVVNPEALIEYALIGGATVRDAFALAAALANAYTVTRGTAGGHSAVAWNDAARDLSAVGITMAATTVRVAAGRAIHAALVGREAPIGDRQTMRSWQALQRHTAPTVTPTAAPTAAPTMPARKPLPPATVAALAARRAAQAEREEREEWRETVLARWLGFRAQWVRVAERLEASGDDVAVDRVRQRLAALDAALASA